MNLLQSLKLFRVFLYSQSSYDSQGVLGERQQTHGKQIISFTQKSIDTCIQLVIAISAKSLCLNVYIFLLIFVYFLGDVN